MDCIYRDEPRRERPGETAHARRTENTQLKTRKLKASSKDQNIFS